MTPDRLAEIEARLTEACEEVLLDGWTFSPGSLGDIRFKTCCPLGAVAVVHGGNPCDYTGSAEPHLGEPIWTMAETIGTGFDGREYNDGARTRRGGHRSGQGSHRREGAGGDGGGVKKLYRYTLDCGRMGSLEGLFVADSAEVEEAIGRTVNFGEVLGKHSDISATLEASEFEALTDDEGFVEKFERFGCESGTNPLDYLDEEGCDGDEEEEE